MNRLSLHSSSHKYSPTASDCTFTRSKFQNFPGGACPQTPLQHCACSIYVLQATNARRPENEASARTDNCVLRAPHQSPLYMYAPPPSSISGSAPERRSRIKAMDATVRLRVSWFLIAFSILTRVRAARI